MFLSKQKFGIRKTAASLVDSNVFPVLLGVGRLTILGLGCFWNLIQRYDFLSEGCKTVRLYFADGSFTWSTECTDR
jgi:hypothetical protein